MFGIITKKNLLKVSMRIERNENTANAKDPQDLLYRMGEYNALNEVCRAFGIDLTSAVKEANKRHDCGDVPTACGEVGQKPR